MTTILDADRLSINQAARRVGVHPSTVWRWCLHGVAGRKLPTLVIGARRYVLTADLEQWLEAGREGNDDGPQVDAERAERAGAELTARGV